MIADSSTKTRFASVERNTKETQIEVSLDLDGTGKFEAQTALPFLDHMLDQIARHGLVDIKIKADGDLEIDAHHTVEDIGITLGQAFSRALDKTGIRRYGHAYVPLDEALSRVVLDCSGRPGLEYNVDFVKGTVGDFDVDGAIGTSDLLVMLSSIGCTSECIQDFNADLSVTVMDLLVFLTVLGQTCD